MKNILPLLILALAASAARTEAAAESPTKQAIGTAAVTPPDAANLILQGKDLVRQARATSDDRFYDQAEEAVRKALAISPADFEAHKLDVMVLLGEHEYIKALNEAQELNKKIPDDVAIYGLLTDAYSALGDYKDAETAAQWMLNLRPGNLPAFVNAAHLREIFGDMNGSYDALNLAYQASSPTAHADRASLLSAMGRERRLAGNDEAAEQILKQALQLVPQYNPALSEMAELYLHQKRFEEAIALLRQLEAASSSAQNSYRLAEALEQSGQTEAAAPAYSQFLRKALLESDQKRNSNRELVFYYADRAHQPSKALAAAKQEVAWRHDIYTLDAYAWALHVNGQDREARKQMDAALAVGTRDPKILAHAAQIKAASPERG